jgi:plasmid stabilization system protein ParE
MLDICKYIYKQLSAPKAALEMMEAIEVSLNSLSIMPYRCPLVDESHLKTLGYRKLHIKNYIAFYTTDEISKIVNVERILYARRDWLQIL